MPLKLKGMPPTAQIQDEAARRAIEALVASLETEVKKANAGKKNSIFSGESRSFNKAFAKISNKNKPVEANGKTVGVESIEMEATSPIVVRDVSEQGKKKFLISSLSTEDDGGSEGTVMHSAIILNKTGDDHKADIYLNLDKSVLHSSQTLKLVQLDSGETLPTGLILPCWLQQWGESGSEELFWTSDVARWY